MVLLKKSFWITLLWKQNRWHTSGVIGHTLKLVFQVIKHKDWKFLPAAFLHDIGKPVVAFQDDTDVLHGTYSFHDHEEKSYDMIKNSSLISDYTKMIVRYHYLLRDMKKSHEKGFHVRAREKEMIWNNLDPRCQNDLVQFLYYDDLAKLSWGEQING